MNFNDPDDDDRDIDLEEDVDTDDDLDGDEGADSDDDDVGFVDEEDGDGDDDLPKRLRARINEQGHVIATMSRRLAEQSETARPAAIEVGERPTLESCDYDEDRFHSEIDAWTDRKLAAAQQDRDAPRTAEDEARADVERYEASISKLPYADAAEMVAKARAGLTPAQEFMLSQACRDPGKLLHALGRHPQKLAELVGVRNPAKFIAKAVTLEANMKSGTRRQAPQPERIPRGNAAPKGVDKEEARLEKEAERTGDRTQLQAYRRQKREKA